MIQIDHCKTCGRWWAYDDKRQVSCLVDHQGGCCHYGSEDVTEFMEDQVEKLRAAHAATEGRTTEGAE